MKFEELKFNSFWESWIWLDLQKDILWLKGFTRHISGLKGDIHSYIQIKQTQHLMSLKNCIILKNPKPGNSGTEVKHFRTKTWRWFTQAQLQLAEIRFISNVWESLPLFCSSPQWLFQLDQMPVHAQIAMFWVGFTLKRKSSLTGVWWKKPEGVKSCGPSLPVCSSQTTSTGRAAIASSPVNSYSQM